ncbi:MAG: sugar transferase [Planctomycetes bacterium]|nr:sugar transferase [Planctomycetota bacterium]
MNARIARQSETHPPRREAFARPAQGTWYALSKRAIDLPAGLVGLVIVSPLLLICAAWIKLADGGPVVYTQWRVGRDGWLFRLYKLRTMRLDAERDGGARFASEKDPRLLPCGGWMRRCHVDELPQLWNIVRGQMSLVGPRPERPEIFERMRGALPGMERRLAATPGLTGLAQVRHGYTNDLAGMRRKLAYDLRYLRIRGVWTDLRLILQTLPCVWDRSAL